MSLGDTAHKARPSGGIPLQGHGVPADLPVPTARRIGRARGGQIPHQTPGLPRPTARRVGPPPGGAHIPRQWFGPPEPVLIESRTPPRARRRAPAMLGPLAALASVAGLGWLAYWLADTLVDRLPAAAGEVNLAARAFALALLDGTAMPGDGSPVATQLGTYIALTGAGSRHAEPLLVAREAILVASLVTCIAVLAGARRLGLSWVSSILAAVLTAVVPYATGLAPIASAGAIAAMWVSLCGVAAASRRIQPADGVIAIVAGVAAVLTAPIVAIAALCGIAQAAGSKVIGVGWRTATRVFAVTAITGCAATLVLLAVWNTLPAQSGVSLPWTPARTLIAAVCIAIAIHSYIAARWLRPPAAALGALAAASLIPGAVGTDAQLAVIPLAALLAVAAAEELWPVTYGVARARHPRTAILFRRGAVAAAAATLVIATWIGLAAGAARVPDRTAAEVRTWIADNTVQSSRFLVPTEQWAALVSAGIRRDRLLTPEAVAATLGSKGSATGVDLVGVDFVVLPASPPDDSWADLIDTIERRTVPIAEFGSGAEQLTVAALLPERPSAEELADGTQQRTATGVALAGSSRLELSEAAKAQLVAGEVDGRILATLPLLLVNHTLRIEVFPLDPAEQAAGNPARCMQITAADGVPLQSESAAARLIDMVQAQQSVFRPLSVATSAAGLTVCYSAPSPLGVSFD